jgi:hypothetical protein
VLQPRSDQRAVQVTRKAESCLSTHHQSQVRSFSLFCDIVNVASVACAPSIVQLDRGERFCLREHRRVQLFCSAFVAQEEGWSCS